jgi:LPS sulfotransferase NodH
MGVNQYNFISAPYDSNDAIESTDDLKRLIICTSPRTAGHALGNHIKVAGWGVPAEYFQPAQAVKLYARWFQSDGIPSFNQINQNHQEYAKKLLELRSVNGIFSAKIFPYNYFFLKKFIGSENNQYLHLERQDQFSHLISILTVMLTGRPFDSEEEETLICRLKNIDELGIHKVYKTLRSETEFWNNFFSKLDNASYLNIKTEEFIDSPSGIINRISDKFNLPIHLSYSSHDFSRDRRYSQDVLIKKNLTSKYGKYIQSLINNHQ